MVGRILGAAAGYATLVVVVMAAVGLSWLALGGGGAFAGEGPEPSSLWLTLNLVGGFIAASVGGWVSRRVGRSANAVTILIGLVLLLGVVSALTADSQFEKRPRIDKPVAEMSFIEAGGHAKQPAWYNWVIPLVGAVGVWLGGRRQEEQAGRVG